MIILAHAVALAAVQPAAQMPAAPSVHSEAAVHRGRHCCCCAHGDQDREGCAEQARHEGHDSRD